MLVFYINSKTWPASEEKVKSINHLSICGSRNILADSRVFFYRELCFNKIIFGTKNRFLSSALYFYPVKRVIKILDETRVQNNEILCIS